MKISRLIELLSEFKDKNIYIMGAEIEYINDCKEYLVLDVEPVEDNPEFDCIKIGNI